MHFNVCFMASDKTELHVFFNFPIPQLTEFQPPYMDFCSHLDDLTFSNTNHAFSIWLICADGVRGP